MVHLASYVGGYIHFVRVFDPSAQFQKHQIWRTATI